MAIGTAMALGLASAAGGIASASAAKKGAAAQAQAARDSNATQLEIFDRTTELQQPWTQAGSNALAAMQYEMGMGPLPTFGGPSNLTISEIPGAVAAPLKGDDAQRGPGFFNPANAPSGAMRFGVGDQTFDTREAAQSYIDSLATPQTEYQGFSESPGYQYRLSQGQNALASMASARGLRLSGSTLKDAMRHGEGMAADEYGSFYNRLAAMAGAGQTATNSQAALGQNYANAVGQNNAQAGQARASGYMGVSNALNGTINSFGGIMGNAQSGMYGANPGFGITPSPAGLSAWGYS